MQFARNLCRAAMIFACALAPSLNATEVQTTSYSQWLATVNGNASEWDFNIPNSTYNTSAGYNLNVGSFGPVNVTGPDSNSFYLEKNSYTINGTRYNTLDAAADGVGSMSFTTPAAGLTAFALGIGLTGSTQAVTLTLSDGETFSLNPAVNGSLFEGFSSATPITSFVLQTGAGSQIQLTDFFAAFSNEPATAASSPSAEVATVFMIGGGLLFIGTRRRVVSHFTRKLQ